MMTSKSDESVQKADIIGTAFNQGSLGMEFSWNYERQMHIALAMMMNKTLKKVYAEDEEGCRDAPTRHAEFFNIAPQPAPSVGGTVASMEEMKSRGEVDGEAISSTRTALMGSLSGTGDPIFADCLWVIAVGTGTLLVRSGSMFGPIVYSLMYNIPVSIIHYFGVHFDYNIGFKYLQRMQASGMMDRLLVVTSILGVTVIGCTPKDMVWMTLNVELDKVDEEVTTLQSILDGIIPGLIGLGDTWMYFWLLKKKVNPITLALGAMILNIADAYLGILAG